jgi:hypothetical protein
VELLSRLVGGLERECDFLVEHIQWAARPVEQSGRSGGTKEVESKLGVSGASVGTLSSTRSSFSVEVCEDAAVKVQKE